MTDRDLSIFNRIEVLEGREFQSNLNEAIGENGWVLLAASFDPYGRPVWMIGKENWGELTLDINTRTPPDDLA